MGAVRGETIGTIAGERKVAVDLVVVEVQVDGRGGRVRDLLGGVFLTTAPSSV
ncbi:MAG: hypothetical protein AAGA71_10865 [Pseudomonadota bacterium]